MSDWAEKAEAIAKDYFPVFPVGMSCAALKRDIRLLAEEARAKGIEEAIEAVGDAGGDNCDYHIEAIRKLKEQP